MAYFSFSQLKTQSARNLRHGSQKCEVVGRSAVTHFAQRPERAVFATRRFERSTGNALAIRQTNSAESCGTGARGDSTAAKIDRTSRGHQKKKSKRDDARFNPDFPLRRERRRKPLRLAIKRSEFVMT
jgi:hypothetical protein